MYMRIDVTTYVIKAMAEVYYVLEHITLKWNGIFKNGFDIIYINS